MISLTILFIQIIFQYQCYYFLFIEHDIKNDSPRNHYQHVICEDNGDSLKYTFIADRV